MSNKIFPCLWFDGQAKAAAEMYCAVLGGTITVDTPMVVNFDIAGQKFMGLNGGPHFQINPSVSFYLACETTEEVDRIWEKLFVGGTAQIPLSTYPWSERYGWLKDQFGMTWQITVDKNAAAAQKITPSLLFTEGVHGRGKEAIAFYTTVFEHSKIQTLATYADGQNPYATEGMVLFSLFSLQNQSFIIMDAGMPQPYTFNEGLSFVVDCVDQTEVDYYWEKLTADGGAESMCGWLKDKFGVSWQIVPRQLMQLMSNHDTEKAGRVMQAMLKMRKIVVADLEKAAA